jgi:SAM-dependent methyltransferase
MMLSESGGNVARQNEAVLNIVLQTASAKYKTILDAACGNGELCFGLLRRGAIDITGSDLDSFSIEQCRQLAIKNGSPADFLVVDIERQKFLKTYDVVLLLKGLQGLRNPICALDTLSYATREELVIGIDDKKALRNALGSMWNLISYVLQRLPIVFLGGSETKDWDGVNHFLFSDRAIAALLTRHRYSFSRVDIVPWESTGRRLAIARKRRIKHLVIVAGVPASGKTTVINKLMAGELPDLAKKLGFDCSKNWLSTGYGDVCRVTDPCVDNMLLHFNFTKSLVDGDRYGYEGGVLDLIDSAQRISVVSVWCPPPELRQRYLNDRVRTGLSRAKRWRQDKKNRILLSLYSEPEKLARLWFKWLGFVELRCTAPVVFESTGSGRMMSQDEFRQGFLQEDRGSTECA